MATSIILSEQRKDENLPESALRPYDREELVKLFLAFRYRPYKVVGNDTGITFWFVEEEIRDLKMQYIGNETVYADWRMYTAADSQWRDFVVLWKAELRSMYPDRYKER